MHSPPSIRRVKYGRNAIGGDVGNLSEMTWAKTRIFQKQKFSKISPKRPKTMKKMYFEVIRSVFDELRMHPKGPPPRGDAGAPVLC